MHGVRVEMSINFTRKNIFCEHIKKVVPISDCFNCAFGFSCVGYAYAKQTKTVKDGMVDTLNYNIKHTKGDTRYKKDAEKLLKELK